MAVGAMIIMVCINAGALWVDYAFGPGPIFTPINSTQYLEEVNASSLAGSYAQSTSDQIIDVTGALTWIWDLNVPFFEAFWSMLVGAGIPIELVRIFKIPYRFLEILLLSEVVRQIDLTG